MTDLQSAVVKTGPGVAGSAQAVVIKRAKQRPLPIRFIRSQPFGAIALTLILLFVAIAILAPLVSPYDPTFQDRRAILKAPGPGHLLGTDEIGRDIFTRVLYGARTSLLVSVATVVIGMVIGVSLGIFSGFFGGRWIDTVLQRVLEPLMAIPAIVLLMFVAAMLGPSVRNTIIALCLLVIPQTNRVARAEMLRIREEPFVDAARVNGAGTFRILLKHGLPNLLAPLLVYGSLLFAITIIAESALSFLGIGPPPPNASWGGMLSSGAPTMEVAPWGVIFPGAALSIAVLAFNLLGDALRDFLDPKRTR
ncbi:MAG: Peptide/nickel transport system permease protein [Pseudonocardiales bacterium]|nr:Peptide/nickel transport system permease protein [Pseudonocardiales bacterium]